MNSKPSKSAKKRDAQAVQALAGRLLELSDDEVERLPLDDDLRQVLAATRAIRSRSALRRQRLYLAKRLRLADTGPIIAACGALADRAAAERRLFHQAERWRDRLLGEGLPALEELAAATGRDNARLRSLLADHRPDAPESERRRIARALFREIRGDLGAEVQPDAASG